MCVSFVSYMYCKYLLPLCRLPFHFLNVSSMKKFLILTWSVFFSYIVFLVSFSRNLCLLKIIKISSYGISSKLYHFTFTFKPVIHLELVFVIEEAFFPIWIFSGPNTMCQKDCVLHTAR